MSIAWSIVLALVGILLHSTGVLLQKKGTNGIRFTEIIDLRNWKATIRSRSVATWVAGLVLAYTISVIPTGFASERLASKVVSGISGLGIVITLVLSHFFLEDEPLRRSDIALSSVIAACCVFVVSVPGPQPQGAGIDLFAYYALALAPLLLLLLLMLRPSSAKTKASVLSTASGLTGGMGYVVLNIAVKQGWGSVAGVVCSVHAYEYVVIGFISAALLQVAYKYGDMAHVIPVQMSLTVIYPVVCSYFIFHQGISLVQDLSIVTIGLCCWLILRRH
jgi:drug/metabolite transporter (DMT)-like permease